MSSKEIPQSALETPMEIDSREEELLTRLLKMALKGAVRCLVSGDLNLMYRVKEQTRPMERTSRDSELKVLETSRERASSAESVSRERISRSTGGGRSSIEEREMIVLLIC